MDFYYNGKTYAVEESAEAYISPYSRFMIDNLEPILVKASHVCDYGAGTGILSIIASSYSVREISAIENNANVMELLKRNIERNCPENDISFSFFHHSNMCVGKFDVIVCNPASLPNVLSVNSFCDGGKFGLDMIMEVIDFSQKNLTNNGTLYMIVTGILPMNIIKEKIFSCGLKYTIAAKREIPFRDHYSGIITWVDSLKEKYGEMSYIYRNGQYYEELNLFEIVRA